MAARLKFTSAAYASVRTRQLGVVCGAQRGRSARERKQNSCRSPASPCGRGDETKHFKVLGTTGTGKSTAIGELLAKALERGDRAVFADPDGGYRARFFDRYRGDIVLNPFEPCSLRWDPFAEIRNAYDIEQLAGSLIPDTHDRAAGEWRAYARTFLGAVLRSCRRSNRPDCAELWRLMSEASRGRAETRGRRYAGAAVPRS